MGSSQPTTWSCGSRWLAEPRRIHTTDEISSDHAFAGLGFVFLLFLSEGGGEYILLLYLILLLMLLNMSMPQNLLIYCSRVPSWDLGNYF
jgi:hypothetical protein